jgi:hypothetical protein
MDALVEIKAAGLVVSLAGGQLKIANPSRLTNELRNLIRSNKQEIVRQLFGTQVQQDARERIEERAAQPTKARVYCYRTTEKPATELVVIMPDTEPDEALDKLKNKYGNRLLDVYPSPHCMAGMPNNATRH